MSETETAPPRQRVSPTPDGNTRVTGKEQFFTPPQIAAQVVDLAVSMVPGALDRCWIEPAGGTGAFVDAARDRGVTDLVSFDIEPRHPRIIEADFLEQHLDVSDAITVSNPPFGRNNALSIPFFNHAARFSEAVTFIVPRSWRKWSVINRLDRAFHLVADEDLSINYVDEHGRDAYARNNLQTCVQVWRRGDVAREVFRVQDRGVVSRCRVADADVALTIFGFSCGTIATDFPRRTITTQMYLQLKHPRALEALRAVDYSRFFNNVAFTQALSLQEVNYLLNEYLFGDPGLI